MKKNENDPLNVNKRLYDQVGLLLDDLENGALEITFPQRLNALIAIAKLQTVFVALRKAKANEDDELSGSAVRDAAKAFQAHGNGRGKKRSRSASASPVITFDDDDDEFDAAR